MLLLLCLSAGPAWTVMEQGEEGAIKAVILESYQDGLCNNGDVEAVKRGFHPEFRLLGVREDKMWVLPLAEWIKRTEEKKAAGQFPPPEPVTMKFPFIDICGEAAIAKVQFQVGDKLTYTDYLSLYKFSEGWKIVNKIYTTH